MNAYELADELDKYLKGEEYDRLVWEAPTMLRQQADRIAELEKYEQQIKQMERAYDAHFKKGMGLNERRSTEVG